MRELLYKKKQSVKHRRKLISVCERSEDKECKTKVRKNFVYVVGTLPGEPTEPLPAPEIFIYKDYNTKRREEKFSFKVRGAFYTTRDEVYLKVDFCHSLHIHIIWKSKNFSPKSATLT